MQPKLEAFVGYTKILAKRTRDQYIDVEEVDEAIALTAIDLSHSQSLLQNV